MILKPIKLALLHECLLCNKLLKNYLWNVENINVLIQTSDSFELISKLNQQPIDVLLIDEFVKGQGIRGILTIVRRKHPNIKMLILSTDTNISTIYDLLDLGVFGYVSKLDEPEKLLEAIFTVSQNKLYRNELFTEALYWSRQNASDSPIGLNRDILDERETKILKLLWQEKSNKEIANEVCLSVRSIEKIRQDMKEKIGVKSTVGLLKYAIDKGIIEINSTY